MKHSLICLLIPFFLLGTGDSFYKLTYTRLDGTAIAFSGLQGRRVILFPFDGSGVDWTMLKAMDSLQKLHPDSLAVIAFPALDFDSVVNVSLLGHIHDSLGLAMTIGAPGYVKRNAVKGQLSVFQWLTNSSRNRHFNRDVEADGQLFFVSAKGTLYGIIDKTSYPKVVTYASSCKVWGD